MFFSLGLNAVTIEGVAKAARVSRMTVYGHFGNKETLFAEVIKREAQALGKALSGVPGEICGSGTSASSLRDELVVFGTGLVTFFARPDVKAFNRLRETEASHNPELARAFALSGPGVVLKKLAGRLRMASDAAEVAVTDPDTAARHFVGLLKSIDSHSGAMHSTSQPSKSAMKKHVNECVNVFLRAYAAGRP
jgi:TetR/AcrR family transcriptional repressor of mexJK operon